MAGDSLTVRSPGGGRVEYPLTRVHTLVVGSGAAGLNAAVQARANGIEDLLILTEGLGMGTSINTGSDKQTYYKLGLSGGEPDSPLALAQTLFSGGSMHGDLALVEAALSARAFLHLVNLGVPFPRDRFGQFVGYKTDHDPRQRATSVGPYTSREMCLKLIDRVRLLGLPVLENRLAVSLLVQGEGKEWRAAGVIALGPPGPDKDRPDKGGPAWEIFAAENVILAVGGPGGLYRTSVYPSVHSGGIGLALLAGARARNLQESQFGLSSIAFRWNVSGSFMQVVPRFFSTGADGESEPREFLDDYFDPPGSLHANIFLKGYQWPFDAAKAAGGSSLIDLLVFRETEVKGRRVFLDYRQNPKGFTLEGLSREALDYLTRSRALGQTPIQRLRAMNPEAYQLYRTNGIDLAAEPLEIAVCAQHNNGGLAGNLWWESENLAHLFPVGEVSGTHGVLRPGGAALNSGQVGGFRAAEYIAHRYPGWTLDLEAFRRAAAEDLARLLEWAARGQEAGASWRDELAELRSRMTKAAAHIRSRETLTRAAGEAREQWRRLDENGCAFAWPGELTQALNLRQLCLAHLVYLEAVLFAIGSGQGSRGSGLVLGRGEKVHPRLGEEWRFEPEDPAFRELVLETVLQPGGRVNCSWVPRRPLPEPEAWFETAWADFKEGRIYQT